MKVKATAIVLVVYALPNPVLVELTNALFP
jgi:hypothetical protein